MATESSQATLNLPNIITLTRLAAVPVFVLVFCLPFKGADIWAAGIFLAAGITDALDGYLARRMNLISRFGAFLDPVADKIIVTTALILLVQEHGNVWMAVPAIVIIAREITVSALREWMAEIGKRGRVAVSWLGKVKTIAQIASITLLLAAKPVVLPNGTLEMTPFLWLAYGLLYLATVLTLWSMLAYLQAAWPELWPGKSARRRSGE